MKRRKLHLSVLLGLLLVMAFPGVAFAAASNGQGQSLAAATTVSVESSADLERPYTSMPAGAIEVRGYTAAAIQDAIYTARRDVTPTGAQAIVWLPKGVYNLERGVNISSNIALIAHSDAIINNATANPFNSMLFEFTAGTNRSYDGLSNVIVNGGTWNVGDNTNTKKSGAISLRHSKNIVICNATFENARNHMVNISASKNVAIHDCTFRNAVKTSGASAAMTDCIEAIHMDFANEAGEPGRAIVYDGTPAGDVVVTNCRFDTVFAGVGTHHSVAEGNQKAGNAPKTWKYKGKSLTVSGCVFNNVSGHAIDAFSMDNIEVINCEVQGKTKPSYFARLCDAAGMKISNCKTIAPIWATDASSFTLVGPTRIETASLTGISVDSKSTANLSKVTVASSKGNGMRAAGGARLTAKQCVVANAKKHGIVIESTKGCVVQGCVVKNSGGSGVMLTTTTGANTVKESCVIGSKDHGITLNKAPKSKIVNNVSASSKNLKSKYEVMGVAGSKGSAITGTVLGTRKAGSVGVWSAPANKTKVSGNVKAGIGVCTALATIKENAIAGKSSKVAAVSASGAFAGSKVVYAATTPGAKAKLTMGKQTLTKKADKNGLVQFKLKSACKRGAKYKVVFTSGKTTVSKSFKVS